MSNKITTNIESLANIITTSLNLPQAKINTQGVASLTCNCGLHNTPEETINLWIDSNNELAVNIFSPNCAYNNDSIRKKYYEVLEAFQEATGEIILLDDNTISPNQINPLNKASKGFNEASLIKNIQAKIERESMPKTARLYKKGDTFCNKEVATVFDFKDETGETIIQAMYDCNDNLIGSNHTKADSSFIPYELPLITKNRMNCTATTVTEIPAESKKVTDYLKSLPQWNLWKQEYKPEELLKTAERIEATVDEGEKKKIKPKASKIFCTSDFVNISGNREEQGKPYEEIKKLVEKIRELEKQSNKVVINFYSSFKNDGKQGKRQPNYIEELLYNKKALEALQANQIDKISRWIPAERGFPIGFLPQLNDRILFLDFDHVLKGTESLSEMSYILPDILTEILKPADIEATYSEFSQSGTGLHVLLLLKESVNKTTVDEWIKKNKQELSKNYSCEAYVKNQLIALTFNQVNLKLQFKTSITRQLPNLWIVENPFIADAINQLNSPDNIATCLHREWNSSWTNSYESCFKGFNIYFFCTQEETEQNNINRLARNILQKCNNWCFSITPKCTVTKISKTTGERKTKVEEFTSSKEFLTTLKNMPQEKRERELNWLVKETATKLALTESKIINSVTKIPQDEITNMLEEQEKNLSFSVTGDSLRVASLCGNELKLLFTKGTNESGVSYFVYDKTTGTWSEDKQAVESKVRGLLEYTQEEINRFPLSKKRRKEVLNWSKQNQQSSNITATIKQLQQRQSLRLEKDEFTDSRDIKQKLEEGIWINCPNGIVNLVTKEFKAIPKDSEEQRNKYFLKSTGVDYIQDKDCTEAREFIEQIFIDAKPEDKGKKVNLVMNLIGYALTGLCTESKASFPNFYETGSNGKTSFFRCILKALGTYGLDCTDNIRFLLKGRDGMSEREEGVFLSKLRGFRFLYFEEPTKGATIDMDKIKKVAMGGNVSARQNFSNEFINFKTEFCIFLSLNNELKLLDNTQGAKRRFIQIPCIQKFVDVEDGKHPKADITKLQICNNKDFTEQILWLIVDYANQYLTRFKENQSNTSTVERASALPDCPECTKASNVYFQKQDIIQSFLAECVANYDEDTQEIKGDYSAKYIKTKELYESFQKYVEETEGIPLAHFDRSKYKTITPRKFTEEIKKRSDEKVEIVRKEQGTRYFTGIILNEPNQQEDLGLSLVANEDKPQGQALADKEEFFMY